MKTLIVEDEVTSRLLLQEFLKPYGGVHTVADGKQAIGAVRAALESGDGYDLVCLDIMMPGMDGYQTLREIRRLEEERGILSSRGAKIVMTTALDRVGNVFEAFRNLCDDYLFKPIDRAQLLERLMKLQLI